MSLNQVSVLYVPAGQTPITKTVGAKELAEIIGSFCGPESVLFPSGYEIQFYLENNPAKSRNNFAIHFAIKKFGLRHLLANMEMFRGNALIVKVQNAPASVLYYNYNIKQLLQDATVADAYFSAEDNKRY